MEQKYEITQDILIELKKLLDNAIDPEMIQHHREVYDAFRLKYELQQIYKQRRA